MGRFSDADDELAEPAAGRVGSPATEDAGMSRDGGQAAGLPDEAGLQQSEDEEDYGSDDGWDEMWDGLGGGGVGGGRLTVAKADSLASRFDSLISLDPLRSTGMSQIAGNSLNRTEKKFAQAKPTGLTRDERATTEHVLDPRTRLLLFKMLNSGLLGQINGCVSTGKEANVYHAIGREGEIAIKVYKTSVLTFKDRDRYVSGEFRFRHGYCRSNPRKMVRMWAEKEMRNYKRLSEAGVECPTPLLLREHVLLMSFIGRDGYAAPRLKDATLTAEDTRSACRQVMLLLRAIYQECRLVHADFSEYNLLWYDGRVVVIDVSQAVEHDHPNALAFLRKDCDNAILFFRRHGIRDLPTLQQLFGFVTDPLLRKADEGAVYDAMACAAGEAAEGARAGGEEGGAWAREAEDGAGDGDECGDVSGDASVAERVFAQMHIPRTLGELPLLQIERDIAEIRGGRGGALAYARLNGLNTDLSVGGGNQDQAGETQTEAALGAGAGAGEAGGEAGVVRASAGGVGSQSSSSDESDGEEGEEGEEGEARERYIRRRMARLHQFEDKDSKKDRKTAVKEAKREARANKTPKHLKKAKKKGQKK